MSGPWALRALILLAVDAHDGEWCSLAWLTARVGATAKEVQWLCDDLAEAELMQRMVIHAQPCYGVHVTAALPAVNDVRRYPRSFEPLPLAVDGDMQERVGS